MIIIFKLLISIFFILMSVTICEASYDTPIDIRINGDYLLTDCEPYIENSTVYAPIRSLSEALEATVKWDALTKIATISHENCEIKISISNNTIYINGNATKNKKFSIKNNRIMIPVRLTAELFGADVNWNDTYKNVEISKDGITLSSKLKDYTFTHDELFWLSRIIYAESGGESLEGQIAVGDVVLNRLASTDFPNTVYSVIFDKKNGTQFEPTLNGTIYNSPSSLSVTAAKLAFKNESSVGECLYFFAPRLISGTWIEKNRTFYRRIGNHDFYL